MERAPAAIPAVTAALMQSLEANAGARKDAAAGGDPGPATAALMRPLEANGR